MSALVVRGPGQPLASVDQLERFNDVAHAAPWLKHLEVSDCKVTDSAVAKLDLTGMTNLRLLDLSLATN